MCYLFDFPWSQIMLLKPSHKGMHPFFVMATHASVLFYECLFEHCCCCLILHILNLIFRNCENALMIELLHLLAVDAHNTSQTDKIGNCLAMTTSTFSN